MKKRITELIETIVYILMGIQIVLGVVWILGNLGRVPAFEESKELLQMSENLCVDEYTGFLYPLLLKGLGVLAQWIKVPRVSLLYSLQMLTAYFAYGYFQKKAIFYNRLYIVKVRRMIRLVALYIITVPTVLQVHMAILPASLASSLLIILLADMIQMCWISDGIKSKLVLRIGIIWVICAQISVEYLWLGGIAVTIAAITYVIRYKKDIAKLLVLVLVSVLSINVLNIGLQTPGSNGKVQRTWQSALLTRVVWPNFDRLAYFWKEEIREEWSREELMELSTYPEMVIYEFGPAVDRMFGEDEANNIYWEMIKRTIEMDTKNVVFHIVEDTVSYLCPPMSVAIQLQGNGSSYTGWNYGRMKDYTPRITGYYVNYSLSTWLYLVIAGGILSILNGVPKVWQPEIKRKRIGWTRLYGFLMVLAIDGWYVFSNGHMQDYKKVIVISVLWVFLLAGVLRKNEEIEKGV